MNGAPMCPHCNKPSVLTPSREIYAGRDYGPLYLCKCIEGWAYVGCHKGTKKPLGSLADRELRELRKEAHAAFDKMWKSGFVSRKEAYAILARALEIPVDKCHMGSFDKDSCKKVVTVCTA